MFSSEPLTPVLRVAQNQIWTYWRAAIEAAPQVLMGVVIFVIFVVGARILQRLTLRSSTLAPVDTATVELLGSAAKMIVIGFGIVTALGTMGINVGGLVAGLGLTGFALGFALKDIVSNLVGGLLVLIYKPFQRHDIIAVAGQAGRVREINLRYTRVEDSDGTVILIPNAKLFSEIIRVSRARQTQPEVQ